MALSAAMLDQMEKEYAQLVQDAARIREFLLANGRTLEPPQADASARPAKKWSVLPAPEQQGDPVGIRLGSVGLREAILQTLRESRRTGGYRPAELALTLTRQGFIDSDAEVPLGARVANELARLRKDGKLVKNTITGRYENAPAQSSLLDT